MILPSGQNPFFSGCKYWRMQVVAICLMVMSLIAFGWSVPYYVDDDAPDGGSGQSWETAFQNIQDAIDAASVDGGGDVWIAEGTYKGTEDYVIKMAEGVHLFGGFAGDESTIDQRNWDENKTIIHGERERCCVLGANEATLDGFTIKNGTGWSLGNNLYNGGGMTNFSTSPVVSNCLFLNNSSVGHGSGMYNRDSSSPTISKCIFMENHVAEPQFPYERPYDSSDAVYNQSESSPIISNCTFSKNLNGGMRNEFSSSPIIEKCEFSKNLTGGMYNIDSSPMVSNCSFIENFSPEDDRGGGMSNMNSSPSISNCTFRGNRSRNGGGIKNRDESSPVIEQCLFVQNSAFYDGGGIYNNDSSPQVTSCTFTGGKAGDEGGGVFNARSSSIVTNCIFKDNKASRGGGMHNFVSSGVFVGNCTFTGNSASHEGGGIFNFHHSSITMLNCVVWDNTSGIDNYYVSEPTVSFSCVQGGYAGEGNVETNPMLSYDNRPLPGSPCVDAGDPDTSDLPETDLLQNIRVRNGCVDMGCFEYAPDMISSNLTVVLEPAEGLPVEPSWRISDGPWIGSGAVVGIYQGEYEIEFSHLVDWQRPAETSIVVSSLDCLKEFSYSPSPGNYLWYVDINAQGSNNGGSWTDAFTDIQSAIDAASMDGFGEIWVANGTYISNNINVIELKEGVSLYGGFSGSENQRDQRIFSDFQTCIDGQETRRCVLGSNNSILDGFCIIRGNSSYGSGMYNLFCSPTVVNCKFDGNFYGLNGGGMCNNVYSKPIVIDCYFIENEAYMGGGVFNGDHSFLRIQNCTFDTNSAFKGGGIYSENQSAYEVLGCTITGNTATHGGGMYNGWLNSDYYSSSMRESYILKNEASDGGGLYNYNYSPVFTDCQITDNIASNCGGGMYNVTASPDVTGCLISGNTSNSGGGIFNISDSSPTIKSCFIIENIASENGGGVYDKGSSSLTIVNCLIKKNKADYGGGVYINSNQGSDLALTNTTLTSNRAVFEGGGLYNYSLGSLIEVNNCIIWENNGSDIVGGNYGVSYSCVQGGYEGEGNLDSNPMMNYNPLWILPDSPCIDSGDPDTTSLFEFDLSGNPRVQNGRVDMGCYEYIPGMEACALTVNLEPEEILLLEPRWRICDGPWLGSGEVIDIYPGEYEINFTKHIYWQEPDCGTLVLSESNHLKTYSYTPLHVNSLLYVDVNALGSNNGASWSDAFIDIQSAIDTVPPDEACDIWVAVGTYNGIGGEPIVDGEGIGECVVVMKDGINIYGGFSGDETSLDQRDLLNNETIINGEEIRRGIFSSGNSEVDGVVLYNCNALHGGGIYCSSSTVTIGNCEFRRNKADNGGALYIENSTLIVDNSQFTANDAFYTGLAGNVEPVGCGGGVFSINSSLVISNCYFFDGDVDHYGGGIFIDENSTARVMGCYFSSNAAWDGGGIFNESSSLTVDKCYFSRNNSYYRGGGICNSNANMAMTNSLLYGNISDDNGAGVYNYHSASLITNCTLTGSTAKDGAYQVHSVNSTSTVKNSILWSNGLEVDDVQTTSTITCSCIKGGFAGEGNIDLDPLFGAPEHQVFRLSPDSPCIDSGTFVSAPDCDIRGFPRPNGSGIDMGAYEYWDVSPMPEVIFTIIGIREGHDTYDLNGDGIIDAADLRVY